MSAMYSYLEYIGHLLGIRRKKTIAGRVQDVAEKAVETVQDIYDAAVDTVSPVLARPTRTQRMSKKLYRMVDGKYAYRVADRMADRARGAADRARDAYEEAADTVAPVIKMSNKVAAKAWARTADRASASMDAAGEAAEAAAATSTAAAGAVAAFFGAIFAGLWWLVTFTIKAAILAGVAYAGWQWLQSRQNRSGAYDSYSGGSSYTSTYGNVSPASTSTTATAGAR